MTTVLFGSFLIAHGLIHAGIYSIPADPEKPAPFDPRHSWALTATHLGPAATSSVGIAMALVATLAYVAAGVAFLADGDQWLVLGACAAVTGLLLKALFFHPWLTLGVLIDVAVLWTTTSAGHGD